MVLKENYFIVMKEVAKRLNENKLHWFFYGSANLAFQGVETEVYDIDAYLSSEDLGKIKEIFADKDYVGMRQSDSKFGDKFNRCFVYFNDIEIEFSDGKFFEYIPKNEIVLKKNGFKLNSLENELKSYELAGREDKVKKLRDFLND